MDNLTEDFKSGKIRYSNYDEYKLYCSEEWESGQINELEEEGLIVIVPEQSTENDIHYRHLTEEEFNEKHK